MRSLYLNKENATVCNKLRRLVNSNQTDTADSDSFLHWIWYSGSLGCRRTSLMLLLVKVTKITLMWEIMNSGKRSREFPLKMVKRSKSLYTWTLTTAVLDMVGAWRSKAMMLNWCIARDSLSSDVLAVISPVCESTLNDCDTEPDCSLYSKLL